MIDIKDNIQDSYKRESETGEGEKEERESNGKKI